jgi:hypothetical protein
VTLFRFVSPMPMRHEGQFSPDFGHRGYGGPELPKRQKSEIETVLPLNLHEPASAAKGEMVFSIVRNSMANGWVSQLKDRGLPLVYVISAFESVAREFRSLLGQTRTKWASEVSGPAFEQWLKASVGTVHTFQGREQVSKRPLYSCLEAQTTVPSSGRRSRLTCLTWP